MNDVWMFDGSQWTWIDGSLNGSQPGVYGTKGVGSSTNVPGARGGAVSWADNNGNVWLFGGYGLDETGFSCTFAVAPTSCHRICHIPWLLT